jgi:drug/metabolite transporter (DMT)-like permease
VTRATALAGVLGISFAAIFVRLAAVDPAVSTFFRVVYALPALGVAWLVIRRRDRRPRRSRLLAAASGVLLSIDLTLFHHSIDLIGAGLATVLANTQVLFVGLGAWLLHRERPTALARWVVPMVFGGVILISGLGGDDAFGDDPVGGVLLGLGAGVIYSAFLIAFRASNRGHLAPTAGPLLDATVGASIGALVLGLAFGNLTMTWQWPAHGWLVALALVVQTAGWLLISVALPRLPALDTSVMLLVQPMMALIWARLLFEESLSLVQWTGVAFVVGGIGLLVTRGTVQVVRSQKSEVRSQKSD